MTTFLIYLFLGINVIVCVFITLLVMMQRPKSEGLGAAFGGGVTDSIFGAQTSDVLTKMTIGLGGIFFVITLILASLYSHRSSNSNIHKELLSTPAPVTAPAVVPSPTNATPAAAAPVSSEKPADSATKAPATPAKK